MPTKNTNTKKRSRGLVTLADVAHKAGVSAITVSRVVNNFSGVTPAMREKVQSAIDELGYIQNRSASMLASARSKVVGVLIPSLSNVVFNDVLRGIYDVAEPEGYQILLADTHYSALEEERSLRTLLGQSPDGMIVTGSDQSEISRKMLAAYRAPIVQIMEHPDDPLDMSVGFSHVDAGAKVVRALYDRGYRNIAFIGARMDKRTVQRLSGYQRELEALGLFNPDWVVTSTQTTSIAIGGELLRKLMDKARGKVEVVFCCNDDLALGVLFESRRMNIDIPGELGICGFNDIEAAAFVQPTLSSVYVGRYHMGETAMRMILEELNGAPPPARHVDTGFDVRLRESTR